MASRGAIESQINEAYNAELGGNADAGGLDFYADRVESGEMSIQDVIDQIADSPEGRAYDASGQASSSRADIGYIGQPSAFDVQYNPSDYGNGDYSTAAQRYQTAAYYTPPETVPYREDVNYTQLFGAQGKSIEEGGTPPTAVDINRAFEIYLGRPADMPGIEGYLNSGKSMEQINADLAYASLYNRETALAPNVEYYEAPTEAQQTLISGLGGGADFTYANPNTFNYAGFETPTASEIRQAYLDYFGYAPTAED